MCDIVIHEIDGNVDSFNAKYKDCALYANGEVDCEVIEELAGGDGKYSVIGQNTQNNPVDTEVDVPASDRLNPTKVFLYIAKKIKENLCPECM